MQKGKPTAAEVQPLSRQPLTAYHGLTRGVCRTALLLMLASWLGGCDAAGTICSSSCYCSRGAQECYGPVTWST